MYTPLRQFVLVPSIFESLDIDLILSRLTVYGYRETEKSSRPKVSFVNLIRSGTWVEKCQNLIMSSASPLQQDIVFGRIQSHQDFHCLQRHVGFLGTAKVVLFTEIASLPFFVPCLTCHLITLTEVKPVSFLTIWEAWNAQSGDLHKWTTFTHMPVGANCAPLQGLHDGLVNFKNISMSSVPSPQLRKNII